MSRIRKQRVDQDPTPGDVRPVAMVVIAQTPPLLAHLEDEARQVCEHLVRSGEFNVCRIDCPTWDELRSRLEEDAILGRMAILHFAGHAEGRGFILVGSGSEGELVDVGSLSVFLRDQGLSFVFMNGCLTDELAGTLKTIAPLPSMVVTTQRIYDDVASRLADAFYKKTLSDRPVALGAAFNKATETVRHSLAGDPAGARHRAPDHDPAATPRTPGAAGVGDVSALPWPWLPLFPLPGAYLADLGYINTKPPETTDKRVRASWIVCYVAIILVVGLLSLAASYFWITSPAFHAAFAYGLEFDQPLSAIRGRAPHTGFFIEASRQIILVSFLGLAFWACRSRPLGAPLFPSPAWRRDWTNRVIMALAVITLLGTTVYHVKYAPCELANNPTWLGVEADPALRTQVWMQAWPSVAPGPVGWNEQYLYPYLAYLPYSLVNFTFIAVPMFHVFISGTLHGYRVARFWWCRRILASVRTHDDPDQIGADILATFRRCRNDINRHLLLMLCLTGLACFEATLGYTTLAFVAQIITVIAACIIGATGVLSLLLVLEYARRIRMSCDFVDTPGERPSALARDRIRVFLERSSCARLLLQPSTVSLLLLNVVGILIIRPWILRLFWGANTFAASGVSP